MNFMSQNAAAKSSDIIIAVFLALFAVISFVGFIVLLCRNTDNENEIKRGGLIFLGIFGFGFAIRLVFALCVRGYRADYALFSNMFDNLKLNGLNDYYNGDASSVLYPIVYFIYLIFGGLSNVMGLSSYSLGMQFMIKLPMIAADLITALFVYKCAAKYVNKNIAAVLCAFVCICPIFFIGSSVWGTPLVFTVMFACGGCYFMARKNYIATIAFMAAAAFSSKEGIYLFPVVAVFAVWHFAKAISNIAADKPSGAKLLGNDYRAAITVPIGFIASIVCAYLIGLFMTASYNANPFVYIYEFLLYPLVGWKNFTFNGLSVYSIFNQNGAVPSARFPSWLFACIFGAIIVAVVCVVYFTKRNRATMVMLAAYSCFTLQVYYPGSNAVGFVGVLALLVTAYALVRDKRILTVLFITGLAFTVNSITVLSNAGYLNNLGDYNFGSEETLLNGGMNAVCIVCSVATLLMHLYFTVIAVGVGMTGQKRMLGHADGLLPSVREYVSIKKDRVKE